MYVPEHFRLPDEHVRRLLATPRAGNLVTVGPDGPMATLAPFWFDEDRNRLVTHLVRNNPQATTPATGPAMVILDEADAYVSPLMYAHNDTSPSVPTWDYITIHVWGELHVDDSPAASLAAARVLTSRFEATDVLEPVGQQQLERMARAIVAVEVEVQRVEAKAKMSQNRHPDDIRSLADALEQQGDATLVDYLRTVSLPHAEARADLVDGIRARSSR